MKKSTRRPLTLILGAMPSEVIAIESALANPKKAELEGYAYVRGKLSKRAVVVAYTGVGITNAAMTTALFLHHFRPSELIYTGSGARLDPGLRTGDVVIGKKTAHHNAGNLTPAGMFYRKVRGPRRGQMTPFEFPADPGLLRLARSAARTFPPKTMSLGGDSYETVVKVGNICSGDMFGVTPAKIADIRKKLGSDLIEMEGSAAAQVCWQLGVPHIVIRSGSNRAQPDPGEDYRALGQIAAHQAARFTMHLVNELPGAMNDDVRLVDRMLEVLEKNVVPLTRDGVRAGNKIFGAAILRKADLGLVVAGTNAETECPLWHGEVATIKRLYEMPASVRPEPADCYFLSTHEPCSMCLSAITWAGYDNIYYLFGYEQTRDAFHIPHDLRILREVFRCQDGGYARENAYWASHDLVAMIESAPEAARGELRARVAKLRDLYDALSAVYQATKRESGIPLS